MTITLKPVARSDAAELIEANTASRLHHEPWAQPFTDAEGFDRWFAGVVTGANVGLVAREAALGGIAGLVDLNGIMLGRFQSAYLGYYSMVGFAGRGLMTEAVRLAADYAFSEVGLHRLEANIQPGNLRSIALIRRVGFHYEGLSPGYLHIGGAWRDHERWALLADG